MNNNPVRLNDPTGHMSANYDYGDNDGQCDSNDKGCNDILQRIQIKKKQQQEAENKKRKEAIAKGLSVGALVLDALALGISTLGTITEGAGLALGEAFTPFPAIDGATGFAGASLFYNTYLNPYENALSGLSLIMTATADGLTEQTHFQTAVNPYSGATSTELVLGADTTFALASVGFGNTSFTPEAASDTLVNAVTSYYDFKRLSGEEPAWGLAQYHIGHENGTSVWSPLRWYDFTTH